VILYKRNKHNDTNLKVLPEQTKSSLRKNLKTFCTGFKLGKKLSIKNNMEFKNGNITEKPIKVNADIKLEKDTVIKKSINIIMKYIPSLINLTGLIKISEKIKPSCLAKLKNLFKSQSILHFTFDYLFFYLIK
jgi:hypothetical protein